MSALDDRHHRPVAEILGALAATAAALWVFWPAVSGSFHGEDFLDLFAIVHGPPGSFLLRPFGGHVLVTRNAIFSGLFAAFGFWPLPFLLTSLVTHLLNVALVYAAVRAWTDRPSLACIAAVAFGTCPLNDAVVGFYWVYGHLLATTVALAVCVDAGHLARRGGTPSPRRLLAWLGGSTVAATSYGVGVGVAFSLPVVGACLLDHSRFTRRHWLLLASMPAGAAAIYQLDHWLFSRLFPTDASPPVSPVLVVQALPAFVRMVVELIGVGSARLLSGFWYRPQAVPAPIVAASLGAVAALVGLALVRGRPAARRSLVAALVLLGGVYGVIAAGRGTGMMRAPADTPRYHYLGTAALTLLLACAVSSLLDLRRQRSVPWGLSLAVAYLLATSIAFSRSDFVVDTHVASSGEVAFALGEMQRLAEQEPRGTTVYVFNRPLFAVGPLLVGQTRAFPGWAGLFTLVFPGSTAWDRTIRFVGIRASHVPSAPGLGPGEPLVMSLEDAYARGLRIHVPNEWKPESAPDRRGRPD